MRSPTRPTPLRRATAVLASALLASAALTACGGDDEGDGSASASPTATGADVDPSPLAQVTDLDGVETSVRVVQSFADALGGLRVSTEVLGAATAEGDTISFPITGGNVTYYEPDSGVRPYVQGEIQHAESAGIGLSAGGSTVQLTDFVIDPGQSVLQGTVTVDGEVAAQDASIFFLDGRSLEPLQVDEGDGTAVLQGTEVKLHPDAAAVLRDAFGTEDVPDYLEIGTATITLALPSESPSPSPSESASPSPSESASPSVSVSVSASPSPVPADPGTGADTGDATTQPEPTSAPASPSPPDSSAVSPSP